MKTFNIEKKSRYKTADTGKVFLFAIVCILALNFIFSIIAEGIASNSTLEKTEALANVYNSTLFNCMFTLASFLCLLGIFFAHKKIEGFSYSACKINKKLEWHTILICILIGVVALLGLQYLTGVFDDFLTLIKFPLDNSSVLDLSSWGGYLLGVVVLALIPAIGEELIFRGVILNGLTNRYSPISSCLFSSLMFAMYHMNLQQLFYQFLLGFIMGFVVLKTRSLYSSMIIHFTSNFLVVTMEFVRVKTGFSMDVAHTWWFYILALLLAVITFVILYLINKFYLSKLPNKEDEGARNDVPSPKEERTSMYVWLAFSISAVLLVVSTISSYLGG